MLPTWGFAVCLRVGMAASSMEQATACKSRVSIGLHAVGVRSGSILLKKASLISTNHDSVFLKLSATGTVMMGHQTVDQSQLFYLFNLEEQIPADHLLRRLNPIVTRVLVDLREKLAPFYSDIGRPSIDPELMIWMLIVGYCYGIRFERKLCEEVKLNLGYRWFCRLELHDKVPDHSTFSVNRHGRFRDSDIFRQVFEAVVRACMDAGLVKGEGFAVDASVIEADASRYHGKAPGEIDWSAPERQTRAVTEFLTALDDEDADADRKPPKVISPVDPCSAWTAKANKRVQFGYGLKAAKGDLAGGPVLGLDREGQQARPVWLWAQLSHRHQVRGYRRRRGYASPHL